MSVRVASSIEGFLEGITPSVGVILGSGLGEAIQPFPIVARLPYAALPEVPQSSVTGHLGDFLLCDATCHHFIVASGRVHLYEGHAASAVAAIVRVLRKFGCNTLIVTNASGGCAPELPVGGWMRIRDQINLTGASPLEGAEFVDMSECYDAELGGRFQAAARQLGMPLPEGVYLAVRGPQYETPAEVRAFRALGADAVGMSTVLEVIQARALGMRVAGLSCITNPAAGLGRTPPSHAEVLETGRRSAVVLGRLLGVVLPELC